MRFATLTTSWLGGAKGTWGVRCALYRKKTFSTSLSETTTPPYTLYIIMRPQTAALYTVGALTAFGLGYAVYFDYKRRNDPNFRKNLSNVFRSWL